MRPRQHGVNDCAIRYPGRFGSWSDMENHESKQLKVNVSRLSASRQRLFLPLMIPMVDRIKPNLWQNQQYNHYHLDHRGS